MEREHQVQVQDSIRKYCTTSQKDSGIGRVERETTEDRERESESERVSKRERKRVRE